MSTSKNPFSDTSFIRKVSILCVEHREFKKVILRQDSIIRAEKESLTLIGLEYESCMIENKILDLDSDQKSKVISSCYEDKEKLKIENEKLERNLRFQKKLKWFTGAVGLIGGITLMILL